MQALWPQELYHDPPPAAEPYNEIAVYKNEPLPAPALGQHFLNSVTPGSLRGLSSVLMSSRDPLSSLVPGKLPVNWSTLGII